MENKAIIIALAATFISVVGLATDMPAGDRPTKISELVGPFHTALLQSNIREVENQLKQPGGRGLVNYHDQQHPHPLTTVISSSLAPCQKKALIKLLRESGSNINGLTSKDGSASMDNPLTLSLSLSLFPIFSQLLDLGAKVPAGLLALVNNHADPRFAKLLGRQGRPAPHEAGEALLRQRLDNKGAAQDLPGAVAANATPSPYEAVMLGDKALLKQTLQDYKGTMEDLSGAVEAAVARENADMIYALVDGGAPPSPFSAVFLGDDLELFSEVLAQNPKMDGRMVFRNELVTPLKMALMLGHPDMVYLLVENKVNTDEEFKEAMKDGKISHLQQLLDAGASVRHIDADGRNLLMYGLINQVPLDITAWLLGQKLNLGQKDKRGKTAAHYAAELADDEQACLVLGMLSAKKAPLKRYDRKRRRPLESAIEANNKQAATFLKRAYGPLL